jgi:NAD(P) transhydrogenase subunit alpha
MSPAFIAAEMALFRAQAAEVDIVVTTALIPGKPAPKLWLRDMVELMKPGSVIVDLAAEAGGNCDLTREGEVVHHPLPSGAGSVTILGPSDLPSQAPTTASQLYANNLVHLLTDMTPGGVFAVNQEDEVVRGALVLHQGTLTWPPPQKPQAAPQPAPVTADVQPAARTPLRTPALKFSHETLAGAHTPPGAVSARQAPLTWVMLGVLAVAWLALHFFATHEAQGANQAMSLFAERLTVFMLACFVGWQVVWNVTPALHTPLMSVTNAISGIILLGGMLHTLGNATSAPVLLGIAAVLLATINVSGGFLVTRRMLRMFRK